MASSKIQNPIDEFVACGMQTIGLYSYILLVDGTGQCYIERIATDNSSFKFAKMPEPVTSGFDAAEVAIDAFWVDPTAHVYKYLFRC
jgi:hypothetical protein